MAVGVVMVLHAADEVFVGGTVINLDIILTYLPVSLLYILSMAMGYVGLRYIELSISSPICNSSGALVAVLGGCGRGGRGEGREGTGGGGGGRREGGGGGGGRGRGVERQGYGTAGGGGGGG